MVTVSLDDFLALNDQLAALARAGIPVDVGLGAAELDASAALERLNANVARRVRQGVTIGEALAEGSPAVPETYRYRLAAGLHSGRLATALGGYTRLAQAIESALSAARAGLLYPLVVCCFAYAGVICLCLFLEPALENLHGELRLRPGMGLNVLQSLRSSLPYWVAVPPAALLVVGLWRVRAASRRVVSELPAAAALARLPGMAEAVYWERCANFAETLSGLLRNETPFPEGLLIAGGASGDASLRSGAKELAEGLAGGQMPPVGGPVALRFPPFLRWALWHSEETIGRPRALAMAAGLYRNAAARRAERLRTAAPLAAVVLLGGSATMLYGLLLFLPVIELLNQLAS